MFMSVDLFRRMRLVLRLLRDNDKRFADRAESWGLRKLWLWNLGARYFKFVVSLKISYHSIFVIKKRNLSVQYIISLQQDLNEYRMNACEVVN